LVGIDAKPVSLLSLNIETMLDHYSLTGLVVAAKNCLIFAANKGSAWAKTDETTISAILETVEGSEGWIGKASRIMKDCSGSS